MDEDWAYKELVDEHTNGECNRYDWLALQQVVAGRGSLRAVAGARRVFAAEGWELADPVPEEGPLRLLRR
jgi:hypothetical protein